jgi:hypothetical protein
MHIYTRILEAAFAVALLAAAPAAAESVQLSDRARFGPSSGASSAVREECGLEEVVPQEVRSASPGVELVSGRPSGPRTLELEIAEVHAPGGGPFSGPKWMVVAADLREHGKTVATARAKRVTSGAPFSGGTCDQLRKVARAIGSDLAGWIADPRRGAVLGD